MILFIGKKTTPSIYKYLDSEAKRIATNIVSGSTNKILSNNINYSDLIDSKSNSNMEIEFFDYNTKEVNKLLLDVTMDIQNKLLNLEEGNVKNFNKNGLNSPLRYALSSYRHRLFKRINSHF